MPHQDGHRSSHQHDRADQQSDLKRRNTCVVGSHRRNGLRATGTKFKAVAGADSVLWSLRSLEGTCRTMSRGSQTPQNGVCASHDKRIFDPAISRRDLSNDTAGGWQPMTCPCGASQAPQNGVCSCHAACAAVTSRPPSGRRSRAWARPRRCGTPGPTPPSRCESASRPGCPQW